MVSAHDQAPHDALPPRSAPSLSGSAWLVLMFLGLQIIMGIILKIVVLMVPALDVSPLLIGMANLFAAAVTISIGLRRAGASWRDLPIITPFRLACVGPLALAIAGGVMGTRHFLDGGRRQP